MKNFARFSPSSGPVITLSSYKLFCLFSCCNSFTILWEIFCCTKRRSESIEKVILGHQKHRQVTKIISKTLRLVGLRSLWLRFRKRQNMIDEGNKVAKLNKLLKWSHRSFISLRDLKKFLFQKVNYDFFWLSEKRESSWDFLALNNSKRSIKREKVREPGV